MLHLGPGSLLGSRYRLVELRATGASADVWLAHDELLARRVAVKLPRQGVVAPERSATDSALIAALDHSGLVTAHDTVAIGPSIEAQILDWVDGTDLRNLLDSGVAPIALVEHLARDLHEALVALHGAGLVHRDVKPANIMICTDGTAKLIDFDIAIAARGSASPTAEIVGTAKYMSPEQVRCHELDGRSDTFSLCVVLYEALTGHSPFTGNSEIEVAMARFEYSPPDPRGIRPDTPAYLADLIMQGMSVDPADRWTRFTLPPLPQQAPVVTTRRRMWRFLIGISVVIAVGALGIWLMMSGVRSLAS